ncbi:MAG TPA: CRISPR-associated protein Cas4 [Tepidisphaeraceae bacterium]|nr:CRISPR-associated protein Cas4 [Tepidisphaeraceae bacterium]
MFDESDLLPISALQHLLYCPRQCALIHVERLWAENRLTVEGRQLHAKAHQPRGDRRGGVRTVRGLALRSLSLGLFGVADVVEFHDPPPGGDAAAAGRGARGGGAGGGEGAGDGGGEMAGTGQGVGADAGGGEMAGAGQGDGADAGGRGGGALAAAAKLVLPIEYKRGLPKKHDADRVQLCAQALCLEEMLGVRIERGLLFYGKTRRREQVALTPALRELTARTAARLHETLASGRTPAAQYEKSKCDRCSLKSLCLPETLLGSERASRYLGRMLTAVLATHGPASDQEPM